MTPGRPRPGLLPVSLQPVKAQRLKYAFVRSAPARSQSAKETSTKLARCSAPPARAQPVSAASRRSSPSGPLSRRPARARLRSSPSPRPGRRLNPRPSDGDQLRRQPRRFDGHGVPLPTRTVYPIRLWLSPLPFKAHRRADLREPCNPGAKVVRWNRDKGGDWVYDLVIHGGYVMDPESGLADYRDVAVADGVIACVSPRPA